MTVKNNLFAPPSMLLNQSVNCSKSDLFSEAKFSWLLCHGNTNSGKELWQIRFGLLIRCYLVNRMNGSFQKGIYGNARARGQFQQSIMILGRQSNRDRFLGFFRSFLSHRSLDDFSFAASLNYWNLLEYKIGNHLFVHPKRHY